MQHFGASLESVFHSHPISKAGLESNTFWGLTVLNIVKPQWSDWCLHHCCNSLRDMFAGFKLYTRYSFDSKSYKVLTVMQRARWTFSPPHPAFFLNFLILCILTSLCVTVTMCSLSLHMKYCLVLYICMTGFTNFSGLWLNILSTKSFSSTLQK